MNESDDFSSTWLNYWEMLYSDTDTPDQYPSKRPLLAHYTTMENIEKILISEQIWLSNPLLMNDREEVKFGILNGLEIIRSSDALRDSLGNQRRISAFFDAIEGAYENYGNDHVLDLYVACFSVHNKENDDGQLSMWRGYGNQGKGAAIVFDTSKLPNPQESPLVLGPVLYGTKSETRAKISEKIDKVVEFLIDNYISDERIPSIASALFRRLWVFSVFLKHKGFLEESEWRLVYFRDRDEPPIINSSLSYEGFFSYFNGPSGMQAKLKLPIGELLGEIDAGVTFCDIVDRIIIGPSAATPLAKRSVERMLISMNKQSLIPKVTSSGIPFRA